MSRKLPVVDREDLRDIESIRFYALYDKETKSYLLTPKGKYLWNRRADVKTAIYHHTGQYWKDIKNRFIIREFQLREVQFKNKYFSELYRKEVGEF